MTRLIDADALLAAITAENPIHTKSFIRILDLITNAPAITQGEPVAWISDDENFIEFRRDSLLELSYKENEIFPLYTSPPQQQWVGLTSEQITNIGMQHQSLHQVAKAIDNELRKLNNV